MILWWLGGYSEHELTATFNTWA